MGRRYLVLRFHPEERLREVLEVLMDNYVKLSGYLLSALGEGADVEGVVEDMLIVSVPEELLDVFRAAVAVSYVEGAAIASERCLGTYGRAIEFACSRRGLMRRPQQV